MSLDMEVGLGPEDIVLGLSSSEKGAEPPLQLSVHIYCGRTREWIKMSLGMEVGLVPFHIVLDEDPAPVPKRSRAPSNFRPMFVVAKRLDASRCRFVWR